MKSKQADLHVTDETLVSMLGNGMMKVVINRPATGKAVSVYNRGAVFLFPVDRVVGNFEVILGPLISVEGIKKHWLLNRLFFLNRSDAECVSLLGVLMNARYNGSCIVYLGIPYKEEGMFWCNHHCAVMENEPGTCGKSCDGYQPRNGKRGMCINKELTFHEPGSPVIILEETAKTILHGLNI